MGPRDGPQTPRRSSRPGEAVALLDRCTSRAPVGLHGGPEMAPKPPDVRSAPAQPWRFSGVVNVVPGLEMAPKAPDARRAPAKPGRPSTLRLPTRAGAAGGREWRRRGARDRAEAVRVSSTRWSAS